MKNLNLPWNLQKMNMEIINLKKKLDSNIKEIDHLESKLEKLEKETDDNATVPPPPGIHYMVGSNDANKTHPGKRKRSVQDKINFFNNQGEGNEQ